MFRFSLGEDKIRIPVDADFEVLKKRFESSKHFKQFEEIKASKKFKQKYEEYLKDYQKIVSDIDEFSKSEKEQLSSTDNVWNYFYGNALCNLYSIALERYLAEEIPLEESMEEMQTEEFYIKIFAEMLLQYLDYIKARVRNIQMLNWLKKGNKKPDEFGNDGGISSILN